MTANDPVPMVQPVYSSHRSFPAKPALLLTFPETFPANFIIALSNGMSMKHKNKKCSMMIAFLFCMLGTLSHFQNSSVCLTLINVINTFGQNSQINIISSACFSLLLTLLYIFSIIVVIKPIEVAAQMSSLRSRQMKKQTKGNRRRTDDSGMSHLWGCGKHPYHSFICEVELLQ